MTGFEISKNMSDDETPTWCLQEELEVLEQTPNLSEKDIHRKVVLKTLLAARSEMES